MIGVLYGLSIVLLSLAGLRNIRRFRSLRGGFRLSRSFIGMMAIASLLAALFVAITVVKSVALDEPPLHRTSGSYALAVAAVGAVSLAAARRFGP